MKKQFLTTQYLYGCEPTDFAMLLYVDALEYKKLKAKELIYELMEEHYAIRDDERVLAIGKAIKFCDDLLKELEC